MHTNGEANAATGAKDAPNPGMHTRHEAGSGVQSGTPVRTEQLNVYYGKHRALKDITLAFEPQKITALLGPSGCGKSTLLRTLNRLHEVVPGARSEGKIFLGAENILARRVNPVQVRRRVGMVFQKPNPFPTLSIRENAVAGLRLEGKGDADQLQHIVEASLQRAYLWEEVKDKLDDLAGVLSGGQQQRLCIARALAVEPEVILMDEPCSALDPISTRKIEELLLALRQQYTIVMVTHSVQQAARASDFTAVFMLNEQRAGELVEFGTTRQVFTQPKHHQTQAYVAGAFG
jgi:phosphate transport system ATP-binding protein